MKTGTVLLILIFCFNALEAAGPIVSGSNAKDSVELGELIPFSVSIRHSSDSMFVFADKRSEFGSVELHHFDQFPTQQIDDSTSYDSIVYYFQGLENLDTFSITIPVFLASPKGELSAIDALVDTVYRRKIITALPQQPTLKSNTDFISIPKEFNSYVVYLVLCLVVWALLVIGALLYHKYADLSRYFFLLLWHRRFSSEWERIKQKLKDQPDRQVMERAVLMWKRHAQKMTGKPYLAMSSKELTRSFNEGKLNRALKEADRWIYGSLKPSDPLFVAEVLEAKSKEMFDIQKAKKAKRG